MLALGLESLPILLAIACAIAGGLRLLQMLAVAAEVLKVPAFRVSFLKQSSNSLAADQ